MSDDFIIPAAHISDLDLSATPAVSPEIAAEIARLGDLVERGDESPEEFVELVKLLHRMGFTKKAEYLLRRNVEVCEGGLSLYLELFGQEKPEEFSAAIEAFAEQFSLEVRFVENRDFLDSVHQTEPRLTRFDQYKLLSEPCRIRFNYSSEDAVEAYALSLSNDTDDLCLRWVNGVWEAIDAPND